MTKITKQLSAMTYRWFAAMALIAVCSLNAVGQISTTVTMSAVPIAGSPFGSFAAAITAVNGLAITGPVVVDATAGQTETAPAGGYTITATGTVANTITIQRTGPGANPQLTASAALTVGSSHDAIIEIVGGDYISVDGFTMLENAANTTGGTLATNNMTEWGVAVLYASTSNGSQNITIKNCTIDLNRTYSNTYGIYVNATHSTTAPTTSATATGATGGNHNLTITGNTVTDVNNGIVVVGPTAAADHNTGVVIGGSSGNANTITNYGTATPVTAFANVSGTLYGVLIRNSTGYTISHNSITSSAGNTSGTLRGIYNVAGSVAPTGTFTNNINNNTLALTYGVSSGTMQGITVEGTNATTTSSLNINNNNFTSLGSAVASSVATTAISTVATHLNTTINSNTFTNLSTVSTGSFTFISHSYSIPATGSATINNNSIVTAFNKTGAGGTVTCTTTGGSSGNTTTFTQTGNNFSNITVTGATGITGFNNTDGAGTSPGKTITGNTLSNWTGGTSTITGMSYTYWGLGTPNTLSNNTISNITGQAVITGINIGATANGTNTLTFASNTITNLTSTGTGGAVTGIVCANTSTQININNNAISTLASTGASAVTGISRTGASNTDIFKNTICDLSGSNASSTVNGILVSAGTIVTISNNRVGDLRATAANGANPVNGINITGGTTVNAYYNTVNLNASSIGALFGSSAVSASTTPTVTLRNNVFVNTSTVNGAAFAAAYRRSTTTLTSYGASSNNNLFYAGTPSATNVIFYDGTNNDQTLAAYKTRVSARDGASVTEAPNFLSTSCGNSNFLKINTGIPTQIESSAATIAGITDDFEGDTRNATTPDMGADEFAGIAADITGPAISYTLVGNTACTNDINLSATITDASLVNTAPGTKPRLYYKKSTNANTYAGNTNADDGWKYVEATNAASPFTFTTNYALLQSAVVAGDVIEYFVVAEDLAGTPNVGINNGVFAATPASVALTAGAFPITGTINSFTILNSIAASVTIGVAETYPTLTGTGGLFEAINNNSLAANTVATIVDAAITEPGTVALNQIAYGCATYTLTIKPQTTSVLTGTIGTGSVIKLNGADNVIIDGSNSGGTDRSLTIQNTTTTTSGNAVIWLASPASGNGATNNIIKNCIIEGNSLTTSFSGLHIGGNTTIGLTTAGTERNSNNTVQNNLFRKTQYGLTMFGFAAASPDLNNVVTQNNFGTAVAGESHGLFALNADRQQSLIVSFNEVQGVTSSTTTGTFGGMRLLDFKDGQCYRNNIHDLSYTGTSTPKIYGIAITSSTYTTSGNPSNALVYNNTISRITSSGISAVWNLTGILASAGYGDRYYHNSVHLTGQINNSSSGLSAAFANGDGNITSNCTNIDVRNNIFNLEGSGLGGNVFAFYSTMTTWTGSQSNNNLLRCAGTGGTQNTGRYNATIYSTLANWQAATAQDANSVATAPVFTSNTDLHLVPASNVSIDNLGTPLAAVTTDIDGAVRSLTAPDMGADEFTPPACVTAVGGTANGSASFCGFGTPTITCSGYSTGLSSTYQWYTSTNIGDYPAGGTAISGQTNPASLITGTVVTTSYYWLRVTCATDVSTDNSTLVTITINTPQAASVTPTSAIICSGNSTPLLANGESYTVSGTLQGSQEVPPVAPAGSGTVTAFYNAVTNILSLNVAYSGLTSNVTAAHIHGPAASGSNAGILYNLVPSIVTTGATSGNGTGNVTLSAADETSLLAGLLYVNIHTVNNGGGEVRAQLTATLNTPTTFSWTPAAGLSNASIANPTASPTITTNYVVTVSDAGGCTATASTLVTVTPSAPSTTSTTICQGGSGTISASGSCTSWISSGTVINGALTAATDPVALRLASPFLNENTCAFDATITRNYTALNFQVTVTGNYVFDMTASSLSDNMGYIVQGAFIPGNCGGGGTFVRGDDDDGTGNLPRIGASGVGDGVMTLTAGTVYTLITLNYSSTSGTASGTYTWTITPPSGGVVLVESNGTIEWYDAISGGSLVGTGSPFNPVPSPLVDTNTPGTYTYYATCSNSTCRTAANFVVEATPTANAGGNGGACASGKVLTGSVGGSATGGIWSTSGDGTFNPNNTTLNATYVSGPNDITNGTVTLTLTTTGSVACAAVNDQVTYGISNGLPATPTAITGAPVSACAPAGPFTLSTTSAGATNINWYEAPGSNGVNFLSANGSPSRDVEFLATTNSTWNIRVNGVNACGPSAAYAVVSVRQSTGVPATITGDAFACGGDTKTYSHAAVTGATSYQWTAAAGCYFDGNPINTPPYVTTNTSVNVTFPGGYTTGVVGVASQVACFTSAYKNLTVNNTPPLPGVISGTTVVCSPQAGVAYSVTNTPGLTYTWTAPANASIASGQGTNAVTVNYAASFGGGQLQVVANSACGTSAARKLNVTVTGGGGATPRPTSITGQLANLCSANGVQLTANPFVAGATYTFSSTVPGATLVNTVNNVATFNFPNGWVNGTVSVIQQNACATASLPRTVDVKSRPAIPVITGPVNVSPNSTGVGYSVPLLSPAVTYTWFVPAGATVASGQGTNSITVDFGVTGGQVKCFQTNGCGNATGILNVSVPRLAGSAAQQEEDAISFSIYPNPADNYVTVQFASQTEGNATVQIIDLTGKVVSLTQLNTVSGINTNTIDVSNIAKGMYLMNVQTPDGNVQTRIAVQ